MSHQERNTLVSLICNLAINGYFIWHLMGLAGSGALDGPEGPQAFGRAVIWLILVAIALSIGLIIAFNILFAIVTRDEAAMITDERDHLFENRGMGATMAVSVAGFIACFAVLAWGVRPVTAFMVLYFAFALGSLAGDLVRLASYRAGG